MQKNPVLLYSLMNYHKVNIFMQQTQKSRNTLFLMPLQSVFLPFSPELTTNQLLTICDLLESKFDLCEPLSTFHYYAN